MEQKNLKCRNSYEGKNEQLYCYSFLHCAKLVEKNVALVCSLFITDTLSL